jgi:hypothetical protein
MGMDTLDLGPQYGAASASWRLLTFKSHLGGELTRLSPL